MFTGGSSRGFQVNGFPWLLALTTDDDEARDVLVLRDVQGSAKATQQHYSSLIQN